MGKVTQHSEGSGEADRPVSVQGFLDRRNKEAIDYVEPFMPWGDQYKLLESAVQEKTEMAMEGESRPLRLLAYNATNGLRYFGCNEYGHIAAKCHKKIPGLVGKCH